MPSWNDLIGGWWLYPRRRERRVVEHHLDVLAHPDVFGLTRNDIERIGRTNRVGLLLAAMRRGWIRVRVYRTDRDLALHVEMWELCKPRLTRLSAWMRRRHLGPYHPIHLGLLSARTRARGVATRAGLESNLMGAGIGAAPPTPPD